MPIVRGKPQTKIIVTIRETAVRGKSQSRNYVGMRGKIHLGKYLYTSLKRMGEWRCNYTILNVGQRWRWLVSITPPVVFAPKVRYPGPKWIRDLVGRRMGPNVLKEERNPPYPCRNSNPLSAVQSVPTDSWRDDETPVSYDVRSVWPVCPHDKRYKPGYKARVFFPPKI